MAQPRERVVKVAADQTLDEHVFEAGEVEPLVGVSEEGPQGQFAHGVQIRPAHGAATIGSEAVETGAH